MKGEYSMILNITRKLVSAKAEYHCQEINGIEGNSNYTMGIALKKASISCSDGSMISIAEKYLPLKLLCRILSNLIWLCPFDINIKEKNVRIHPFPISFMPKLTFRHEGTAYEIRLHTGNNVSLTQGGKQIARYKKNDISYAGQNHYSVFHCGVIDAELLFVLCVLIDIIWFKDDTSFKFRRKEKSIVLLDRYKHMAEWMPNQEE